MAIIVEHLNSGNEYVLITASSGVDLNHPSTRLLKSWLRDRVALCDRRGKIFWVNASEITVIEIDGQKLADLLPEELPNPVKPSPVPEPDPDFERDRKPDLQTNSQPDLETDLDEFEEDEEWL